MQSAGLRTKSRISIAPSVDDTASLMTLHTVADSTITAESKPRRTRLPDRETARPSPVSEQPDEIPLPTVKQRRQPPRKTKQQRSRTASSRKAASQLGTEPLSGIESASKSEIDEDNDDSDFEEQDVTPPKFTIDLSKPPGERYNHVAQHFTPHRIVLEKLFRQIVKETLGWDTEKGRTWGRRIFSKSPSAEEEEEMQGISQTWGVEKFLIVAFNCLLDSFMGCTSGGARVRDPASPKGDTSDNKDADNTWDATDDTDTRGRMLHFRTLDWGMEDLRRLVCEYEYVAHAGGPVIARQITYFGFVGVLTGVRKGLSISLNFRPCHDGSSWWKNLCFRSHQIMVLLGWRRSLPSLLRDCLLPSKYQPLRTLPNLVDIERDLPSKKTSAAYLIFSDGSRTTTMEKDHHCATVRSASDFIIALNHDVAHETAGEPTDNVAEIIDADPQRERLPHDILSTVGMDGLVAASQERKKCVADHWKDAKSKRGGTAVQTADVIEWMKDPEISNDETHYTVIMDPTRGENVWVRRWLRPLESDDPR